MGTSGAGDTSNQWKVGLLIVVLVLAGFGAGWGLFLALELPFGIVAGLVGGALTFVLFSYAYYGR